MTDRKPTSVVDDPLVDIPNTAKQLGITPRGVRNWIQRGQIPYVKLMGYTVRIRQSVIDKIIADGEDRSNDVKLPQALDLAPTVVREGGSHSAWRHHRIEEPKQPGSIASYLTGT